MLAGFILPMAPGLIAELDEIIRSCTREQLDRWIGDAVRVLVDLRSIDADPIDLESRARPFAE